MSNRSRIEGIDDILNFLDHLPENMFEITNIAMREGSKAVSKHVRKSIPKRYRKLCTYKVRKDYKGDLEAMIGLFHKGQATGTQPKNGKTWDWFKWYWANYGTLKHRDPSHEFQYPIKKKTAKRRNNTGQRPELFFEKAIKEWEEIFATAFDDALAKSSDKLYKR